MRKRKILFTVIVMTMLTMCACGKKDPVSEKMIQDIEELGEITLEDEERINQLMQTYSTFTDEQKKDVKNYVDLLNASDIIIELKNAETVALENERENLSLDEKIAIAAFQGVIQDAENGVNSFVVSNVSVKQYTRANATASLLKILDAEEYSVIDDERTWIVHATYSYVDDTNTKIEMEEVYGSVLRDGSAAFGKGITYTVFGETRLYQLYEQAYNGLTIEAEELDVEKISRHLDDLTISVEVQEYLRSLE